MVQVALTVVMAAAVQVGVVQVGTGEVVTPVTPGIPVRVQQVAVAVVVITMVWVVMAAQA